MRTPAWLKNYQRPMPMMPGMPIGKPSRYTGAGSDGKIQRDKPVETELFQDHEGETVISAKDTKKAGGPIGIEKKLGINLRKNVPPAPIRGFKCGGTVRKYQEGGTVTTEDLLNRNQGTPTTTPISGGTRTSFMPVDPNTTTSTMPVVPGSTATSFDKQNAEPPIVVDGKSYTPAEWEAYQSKGLSDARTTNLNLAAPSGGFKEGAIKSVNGKVLKYTNSQWVETGATSTYDQSKPPTAPISATPPPTAVKSSQGFDVGKTRTTRDLNGVVQTERFDGIGADGKEIWTKVGGTTIASQVQGGAPNAPIQPAPSTAVKSEQGIAVGGIRLKRQPDGTQQQERYDGKDASGNDIWTPIGLKAKVIDAQSGQPIQETATAGDAETKERDYYSGKAGDFVGMMEDVANGTSPVFQKMQDIAFGNLNPTLQVGLTLTAMQIAQDPSMSKGMAQTMMAQAIRNVGVQQSKLASDMAVKAMDLAYSAIGQGFTMSANQQSFYETARANAKSEAWKDFEYTAQYGSDADVISAYKTATGRDLNPAAVAEVRGYARTLRTNNLVKDSLAISSAKTALGDQNFNSAKGMISEGATFAQVQSRFPEITQEMFNSIRDASLLGNRDYERKTGLINTLLKTPNAANLAQVKTLMKELYPGVTVDFSGILTEQTAGKIADAMTMLNGFVINNTPIEKVLPLMAAAGYTDLLGGEDAVKSLYESSKTAASPYEQMLSTYDDAFIAQFPEIAQNADGTPNAAGIAKIHAIMTKHISYNEQGMVIPDFEGISAELEGLQKPAKAGDTIEPNRLYTAAEIKTMTGTEPSGTEWTSPDGKTKMYKNNGMWSTTIPESKLVDYTKTLNGDGQVSADKIPIGESFAIPAGEALVTERGVPLPANHTYTRKKINLMKFDLKSPRTVALLGKTNLVELGLSDINTLMADVFVDENGKMYLGKNTTNYAQGGNAHNIFVKILDANNINHQGIS